MTPRLRPLPLILISASLLPSALRAGEFTYSPFTGDADSGINSGLTYTAIADFNGTGARTINGVNFANTGNSGTNYTLATATTPFAGDFNILTGTSNGLASDFFYTGDSSGNATVTLTGLTSGQSYVTTWYNTAFGGAGGRRVNITPSDTGTPFTFDENYTGDNNGNVLRYAFTATGPSISFGFDAIVNGDSFHHYGMTNSVRNTALLTTPTISSTTGATPFSPYSPSNTDLLQTAFGSATSAGNFTQEGAGGVPILNNGQFTIGGGGNNGQMATAGNNSFVSYALDLTAAPLGYDITGIDTYGGWNDSGRDRQLLKISYSLVGSPDFVHIGSLDSNPAIGGGIGSAVRAQFPTSLTGVDAVRFDWFNGQENGYAGIGEIDVFGAATVPEPATTAVLLMGSMFLLRRRRRN